MRIVSNGDYAFDAGIVTVSCESEGQGFLVSRHSILKNIFQNRKCIKRCIEILPLGDAQVHPLSHITFRACRSVGKGFAMRKSRKTIAVISGNTPTSSCVK